MMPTLSFSFNPSEFKASPGEMADADFGYVGGGPGRITLFEGKTAVKKNIPEEDAIEELVNLIKERGRWQEP